MPEPSPYCAMHKKIKACHVEVAAWHITVGQDMFPFFPVPGVNPVQPTDPFTAWSKAVSQSLSQSMNQGLEMHAAMVGSMAPAESAASGSRQASSQKGASKPRADRTTKTKRAATPASRTTAPERASASRTTKRATGQSGRAGQSWYKKPPMSPVEWWATAAGAPSALEQISNTTRVTPGAPAMWPMMGFGMFSPSAFAAAAPLTDWASGFATPFGPSRAMAARPAHSLPAAMHAAATETLVAAFTTPGKERKTAGGRARTGAQSNSAATRRETTRSAQSHRTERASTSSATSTRTSSSPFTDLLAMQAQMMALPFTMATQMATPLRQDADAVPPMTASTRTSSGRPRHHRMEKPSFATKPELAPAQPAPAARPAAPMWPMTPFDLMSAMMGVAAPNVSAASATQRANGEQEDEADAPRAVPSSQRSSLRARTARGAGGLSMPVKADVAPAPLHATAATAQVIPHDTMSDVPADWGVVNFSVALPPHMQEALMHLTLALRALGAANRSFDLPRIAAWSQNAPSGIAMIGGSTPRPH